MTTISLTSIGTISPTPASGFLVDQYKTALSQDFVPRNLSGVATTGAGSLGDSTYAWNDIYLSGDIIIDGQELNIESIPVRRYAIKTGKEKSSGYPDFLSTLTNSTTAVLDASTTALEMVVNSSSVTLSSTITYTSLSTAVNTNATANINTSTITTSTAYLYGDYIENGITLNNIGTSIVSLNRKTVSMALYNGSSTEYLVGTVNTSLSMLMDVRRGMFGSARVSASTGNTLTLLNTEYLFVGSVGPTTYKTTEPPVFSTTNIASPINGQFYFNTVDSTWYRYNESDWVALDAQYVGMAAQDTTKCVGIEPEDFSLPWASDCDFVAQYIDTTRALVFVKNVSVAGVSVRSSDGRGQIIDVTDSNDRESGGTYANARLYIYIDNFGKCRFSENAPAQKGRRLGFYHPTQYWRFIFSCQVSSSLLVQFNNIYKDNFRNEGDLTLNGVLRASNQPFLLVSSGTRTTVGIDYSFTVSENTGGFTTTNGKLAVPDAGIYSVTMSGAFSTIETAKRQQIYIIRYDSADSQLQSINIHDAYGYATLEQEAQKVSGAFNFKMNTGDYIGIYAGIDGAATFTDVTVAIVKLF